MAFWATAAPYIAAAGSTLLSNFLGQQNATTAWERSQEGARYAYSNWTHRYQDTVKDMKAAGLNPILAASGGFNVSGAGSQQPDAPQAPTPMVNFSSSAEQFASANKQTEEIAKIRAETEKIGQDAKVSMETATKLRAETGKITAEEKTISRRFHFLDMEFKKLTQETYKALEEKYQAQTATKIIKHNLRIAQGKADQIRYELSKLKQISDIYDSPVGRYLQFIESTLDSLNMHFGVGIGARLH